MQERNKNYIKKISIQGFRGFKDKETINFAYPDQEGHCGLNIIVGQNCSGKSTIIEAIKLLMQSNRKGYFLSKSKKNSDIELDIEMENINCTTKLQTNQRRNFAKIINIIDGEEIEGYREDKNYFLVPSRKNVVNNNLYNHNDDNIESFLINYQNNNNQSSINRRNTNLNNEFVSVLTTIYADEDKKSEFDNILKRFFEDVTWNLYMSDEQDNSFVVDIQDKCGSTHFEGVGDGIITIIYICVGLFMLEQNLISVLLIDEPEVSLHTQIIKKISEVLREYSNNYQIIISTHSPYLIDWKSIKNGGKLIRAVNEERIRIYELENKLIEDIEMNPSNNPHLYGTTAKEVFFLKDRIVLVEGQEDVVCYNKILEKLSQEGKYNFYGWGTGGATNIRLIMRILKSLGYKKIVGIFDGDDIGKKEAEKCNKEFDGKYIALNICTEDIRDKYISIYNKETLKKEEEILQKEGVCDEKLKIKDNFEQTYKEGFINIFSRVDTYFERKEGN